MRLFDPNRTDYIERLNDLADTSNAAAARLPRQQVFVVGVNGQSGTEFVLEAEPLNGICIFSIDGYVIHHCDVNGMTVTPSTPAEPGEEVMIVYWA